MLLGLCKENNVVTVLQVHDSTECGQKPDDGHPDGAVEYWLSSDIRAISTATRIES